MTAERKLLDLTPRCPSIFNNERCTLKLHVGTPHWNGKVGDDRFEWNDAQVIAELQELIENLRETNRLSLM